MPNTSKKSTPAASEAQAPVVQNVAPAYTNPSIKAFVEALDKGLVSYRAKIQEMKSKTPSPCEFIRLQAIDSTVEDLTAYIHATEKELLPVKFD